MPTEELKSDRPSSFSEMTEGLCHLEYATDLSCEAVSYAS